MSDKEFAEGIYFNEPHEKAPDFVLGGISVNRQRFMEFLDKQTGDYVNLDVKRSKSGKIYCEVNHYKKKDAQKPDTAPSERGPGEPVGAGPDFDFEDSIPF